MKTFKLLDCMRSDCRFTLTDTTRTAAYYAPLYDRKGNNIAVDLNITTGKLSCSSCNRVWSFKDSYQDTIYEEIK
jgi:hypothetical protein